MAPASSLKASAPGSFMLLGEHAVLHGKQALVCAASRRMFVTLTPRNDHRVVVRSALGENIFELAELQATPPHQFVLASINSMRDDLPSGFEIDIESEFSDTVGLGSSAAVTATTIAVLQRFLGHELDPDSVFQHSLQVVRSVQGIGSGADVAASVYGGVVAYRAEPLTIRKLEGVYPITLVYSGSKRPTVEVIELVEQAKLANPEIYDALFELMDQTAQQAVDAIDAGEWERLGGLLNVNQGLMDAIGVNTTALADIVHSLRSCHGVLGAKISGSGLGDCVVAMGSAKELDSRFERLDVDMSPKGVTFE